MKSRSDSPSDVRVRRGRCIRKLDLVPRFDWFDLIGDCRLADAEAVGGGAKGAFQRQGEERELGFEP
jgi:hypothetical protein